VHGNRVGDEAFAALLQRVPEDDFERLQEIDIVGESHRQDVLADLAGPKELDGKRFGCGATLRCDPSNSYDCNAIRVEVFGQLVGYVARQVAATLGPYLQAHHGGVLECHGLIVGGWKETTSEGHYGNRAWSAQLPAGFLPAPRPYGGAATGGKARAGLEYPTLPQPEANEHRLAPTPQQLEDDRWLSDVTVTCEEHYQSVICSSVPDGWDNRSFPLVVELAYAASNPHTRQPTSVIEIRINGSTAGFFTPKMTARYETLVRTALEQGKRPTAIANARVATKSGTQMWRLKVLLPRE
jgi:hypothetical protein